MTSARTEMLLKYAVFAVLAVMIGFQVWAQRALFADGSFQLMNLLLVEQARALHMGAPITLFHELVTSNNEPTRYFAYLFTELSTVLLLRAGVTNMQVLITFFSAWVLLTPLLFWGFALWKLKLDILFWPIVMIFTFVYFNDNFFSIGEYNMAFGLTGCCLALMLGTHTNKFVDRVVLFACAVLLIATYPSSIILGIVLSVVALMRFWHAPSAPSKAYWLVIAACFLAAHGVGLWGYTHLAHPENIQSAGNANVLTNNAQFWVVLTFAVLVGSQCVVSIKEYRDSMMFVLFAIVVIFLTGLISATPYTGYCVRVFTGMVFFGFGAILGWFHFFGARRILTEKNLASFVPLRHCIMPVFGLFLVLALLDIQNSIGFRHYLDDYSDVVNSKTGLLPFEDSIALIENTRIYGWDWTYPVLGLLLRKTDKAALIMDPGFQQGKWAPFNPAVSVPDLTRYYPGP